VPGQPGRSDAAHDAFGRIFRDMQSDLSVGECGCVVSVLVDG